MYSLSLSTLAKSINCYVAFVVHVAKSYTLDYGMAFFFHSKKQVQASMGKVC